MDCITLQLAEKVADVRVHIIAWRAVTDFLLFRFLIITGPRVALQLAEKVADVRVHVLAGGDPRKDVVVAEVGVPLVHLLQRNVARAADAAADVLAVGGRVHALLLDEQTIGPSSEYTRASCA
eukprot:8526669-Pyramimonas_sp.AAC.1